MRLAALLVVVATALGGCASVPTGPTAADRAAIERMEQAGDQAQDHFDAVEEKAADAKR